MEAFPDVACAPRTLRDALRAATSQSHARLDALFEAVTDPARSELYERFIVMNHAGHEASEPVLVDSPLLQVLPEWPTWSRLPALRLDMAEMRLPPLALPAFAPARPDLPQAVGIAYVLEGSRLGAAVIHRQLQKSLSSRRGPALACHYLRDGAGGRHFRSFIDTVSALDWNERSLNRAGEAAVATFDYFHDAARRSGAATS